jgi:phytanoyl-CoA hydroxylase
MTTFDLPKFASLNEGDIERFRRDGFLIVERFLSEDTLIALRERFPKSSGCDTAHGERMES